jgi:tetratricopeptide (TPR) repeat protein
MVSAPTNNPGAKKTISGRLRLLAVALFLCAVALPVSRRLLLHKPPPPPATASADVHREYWRQRIKDDVSDQEAYVTLGALNERLGYYNAAVRYLLAARALGVLDEKICAPLGRALVALARDEEALPELERAVKLQPDSLDAVLNLSGLYVMQNHPDAAASLLKRFADTHPTMTQADLRRTAFAQLECDNNAGAKAMAERMLSLDGNDLDGHSIAARCSLALKDLNGAKQHTEKLLALSGGEASVHYLHGLILEELGQTDAAIAQWKTTVAKNPNALDAHERLADAYYKRGNYAAAARSAELLARRVPDVFTVRRAAEAFTKVKDVERAAYWRAVQVGLAGDFKAALALGKIAETSKNPEVRRKGLQAVAEAYRGLRQKEPYLAAMQKLTAGGTVSDLRLMARAYDELDRHEDRTRCLSQAVEKASAEEKPGLLYELARAYRVRGMRDEAEKALEEAVRLAPKQAAIQRELAKTYFERRALDGRLQKAIECWQAAITLDDGESEDWQYLGTAYAEAGDLVKASASLEHAIDLEPGSGPAYLELGRVSTRLGDKESAQRYNALYAKYVTFDQERQTLRTRANRPGAPVADLIAYGDLLAKMTVLNEAAQQYERALARTPQDAKLRDKLDALYLRLRQPERRAAVMNRALAAVPPMSEVVK